MAERGKTIPVKTWWLDAARKHVGAEKGLVELGKRLSEHVDRHPWNHGQLSNFANGKTEATLDLILALCAEYKLVPPVFFARSKDEAFALFQTMLGFDENGRPIPKKKKPRGTRTQIAGAPGPSSEPEATVTTKKPSR